MPALGSAGRQPPYVNIRATTVGGSTPVLRGRIGGGPLGSYLAWQGPNIVRNAVNGAAGLAEATTGVFSGRPLAETNRRMAQPGYQPPGRGPSSRPIRTSPADPYGVGPQPAQVSNMRPQDNRLQDYPAGVPRGTPPASARQAPPVAGAPPRRQPPAASLAPPVRSAPMPGFGTPRVEIRRGTRQAAALNNQAQQAGSTVRYASAGDDVRLAQQARSRMIGDARAAGNEIPANLTPASESYWNDADVRAWATSSPGNLKLANDLRRKNGLPELGANGQGSWAPPNIAWSGDIDRSTAAGFGMQDNLAPGAAKAAPAWNIPAGTWNGSDRTEIAFDPNTDLSAQESFQAPAGAWNMQSKFNPDLDLGVNPSQVPAPQSASSLPVPTVYGGGMDLMGQESPAPLPSTTAAGYGAPDAQAFSQRALAQTRKMRSSGYPGAARLNFNPQPFQ